MTRRDFYRYGTFVLGGLMKLVIAVPAVAYLISPLRKKSVSGGENSFDTLTSLSQLPVGIPRSFAIIRGVTDAWVKYPGEPIGSVWLLRESESRVIAYTAECPHLGCAINLTADSKSFLCPCHTSAFDLQGKPTNQIPPRSMDTLEVELSSDPDPKVKVKFERFRTQAEEKIPLV